MPTANAEFAMEANESCCSSLVERVYLIHLRVMKSLQTTIVRMLWQQHEVTYYLRRTASSARTMAKSIYSALVSKARS